jgi:hypothetical protein
LAQNFILGNAEFRVQPIIESINGVNVDEVFQNAWFTHDNVVIETETVLQKVLFDKMLYTNVRLKKQLGLECI